MSMIKKEKTYLLSKPRNIPKPFELEGDLLRECRSYLDSREDLFFMRMEGSGKLIHQGGRPAMIASDSKGFPDLLIVSEGKIFAAELKILGKSMTQTQAKVICGIVRAGGCSGIVCSPQGLRNFLDQTPPQTSIETDFGAVAAWY